MKLCVPSFLLLAIFCDASYLNYFPTRRMLKSLKSVAENVIEESGVTSKCAKDLRALITDLQLHNKLWALRMIDASGKLTSGLLAGTNAVLGNYDECIDIEENRNGDVIKGQYCTVTLVPRNNMQENLASMVDTANLMEQLGIPLANQMKKLINFLKFSYGICIPHSCSIENLQEISNYIERTINSSVHAVFADALCNYKGKPFVHNKYETQIFTFFGFVFSLVILSTVYDLSFKSESEPNQYLIAFSLHTNTRELLASRNSEKFIGCLQGIKFLSMVWVVLGHSVLASLFKPKMNGFASMKSIHDWKYNLFLAPHLAVDTFLCISGLLIIYLSLKYGEKRFSFLLFYLNRLFRIIPSLFATILIYISVSRYLADGPFSVKILNSLSMPCEGAWWITLLQLSNFLQFSHQCVPQAWYLSVDFQLYAFAPLIFLNINKHPKKVFTGIFLLYASSMIYTYIMTLEYKCGNTVLQNNPDFMYRYYVSTFARMPTWMVGIVFGYLIHFLEIRKIQISKCSNIFLLFLSLLTIAGLTFWNHLIYDDLEDHVSALINSIMRPIWATAICYIILSCSLGYGGIINKFLTLPIFTVLSKLNYSIYLIHIFVITVLTARSREVIYYNYLDHLHKFCGDFVFSFLAATVIYLCFESPVNKLWRITIRKLTEKNNMKDKETNTTQQEDSNGVMWVFSFIYTNKKVKTQ